VLRAHVDELVEVGTAKGPESVVVGVRPAEGTRGPRFLLAGEGDREFIRMNSNSYLGMGLHPEVIAAEEDATRSCGAGPGAVRFISGTYRQHADLERELAGFHGREAAMIFSSAYGTVLSTITPLVSAETVLVSDELNHNCIINAMRLSRPAGKAIYPHNDVEALDQALEEWKGKAARALVVTDGIFSMRGDHAPLDEIMEVCIRHDAGYAENVVCIVDDSHGVGAFGATGRGSTLGATRSTSSSGRSGRPSESTAATSSPTRPPSSSYASPPRCTSTRTRSRWVRRRRRWPPCDSWPAPRARLGCGA
jgi:glycine C-acetyltransferase